MEEQDFQSLVLELFRDIRGDVQMMKADMNRRFEEFDKRFEQLEKRMDRMEDILRSDREKFEEIHRSRDKVKFTFGWQWGMVSMLIAIVAAGIAKVFG